MDPTNEDLDGDGIMDGVEIVLLVEVFDFIDINDYYNNNLADVEEENEFNVFMLEISTTGRVFDARMVVEIESNEAEGKRQEGLIKVSA